MRIKLYKDTRWKNNFMQNYTFVELMKPYPFARHPRIELGGAFCRRLVLIWILWHLDKVSSP